MSRPRQPAVRKRAPRPKKIAEGPAAGATAINPAQSTPLAQPALIRVPLSVRWRDLDAFNHVNNSQFLSYLEEARLRWMTRIPGQWMDENVAPVVAAAHINYRRPIEWPNKIVVELFIARLGSTSLTIGHRIIAGGDADVLYADGDVVMVWIHKHDGKPAALPEVVRAACEKGSA